MEQRKLSDYVLLKPVSSFDNKPWKCDTHNSTHDGFYTQGCIVAAFPKSMLPGWKDVIFFPAHKEAIPVDVKDKVVEWID